MSAPTGLDILARLGDPARAEEAWSQFLDRFSGILLRTVRRYASGRDDALDAYLHVCERLVEGGYRRLRAFRGADDQELSGWLTAVTRNLCIDHLRSRHGRRRMPRAVLALDALDREVFEAVYWQGMTRAEAESRTAARHPGTGPARVAEALDRIERSLRPHQLAEIAETAGYRSEPEGPEGLERVADEAPDPESLVLERERLDAMRDAIEALPPDDRLLLRLRYEQGLTLAEAARALGLRDYREAHARLGRALALVRDRVAGRGGR